MLVAGAISRQRLSLLCDFDWTNFTKDEFRQQVVAVETSPAFLGGLGELKDQQRLP
jgi:hypothetical protein